MAKPYFVARAQHEEVVEQQMKQMESLRRRLTNVTQAWKESSITKTEEPVEQEKALTDYELRGPQVRASHGNKDKNIEQ